MEPAVIVLLWVLGVLFLLGALCFGAYKLGLDLCTCVCKCMFGEGVWQKGPDKLFCFQRSLGLNITGVVSSILTIVYIYVLTQLRPVEDLSWWPAVWTLIGLVRVVSWLLTYCSTEPIDDVQRGPKLIQAWALTITWCAELIIFIWNFICIFVDQKAYVKRVYFINTMVEDWEIDSGVAITIATIFAAIQLVFYGFASRSAVNQFYDVYYHTQTEQSQPLIGDRENNPVDTNPVGTNPVDIEKTGYKPLPNSEQAPVEPKAPGQQPRVKQPTMTMKNCVKNDGGVAKQHAVHSYEEQFRLAIRHGKMTEGRKAELLAKIKKIADNDATAFAGVESDIKVTSDAESGDLMIDMVVHYMASDEDAGDRMNVSYAAAKCTIKNATKASQAKASELITRIIQTSLTGLNMPEGDQQRELIQQQLKDRAGENMSNILNGQ